MLDSIFGSDIVEVALALAFVYMIFSSISSGVFEFIGKLFKMRSKHLKEGLGLLLSDPDNTKIVNELYEHGLIKSKLKNKLGEPTYIHSTKFATALFDVITKDQSGKILKTKQEILGKINQVIPDKHLNGILTGIVEKADDKAEDIEKWLKANTDKVENWFNNGMADVSDWFKRKARLILGIIAAVLTIAFNVDSIRMAEILWTDDEVRNATVVAASGYADARMKHVANEQNQQPEPTPEPSKDDLVRDSSDTNKTEMPMLTPPVNPTTKQDTMSADAYFNELNQTLDTLNALIHETNIFPIGWQDEWREIPCCGKQKNAKVDALPPNSPSAQKEESLFGWLMLKIAGLGITWGAIFLGGPSWFDLIKRLVGWRKAAAGGGTGEGK